MNQLPGDFLTLKSAVIYLGRPVYGIRSLIWKGNRLNFLTIINLVANEPMEEDLYGKDQL